VSVPSGVTTELITIEGAGTLVQAGIEFLTTTPPAEGVIYQIIIYCDGEYAGHVRNDQITQSATETKGRCSLGEFYQLAARTYLWARLPYKFRRSIRLYAYHLTGAAVDCFGRMSVSKEV